MSKLLQLSRGAEVYSVLRRTSKSGQCGYYDFYTMRDNKMAPIGEDMAIALGLKWDSVRRGVIAFCDPRILVESLSRTIDVPLEHRAL